MTTLEQLINLFSIFTLLISTTNRMKIQVEIQMKGGNKIITVEDAQSSLTIGQLKEKISVRPNTRCGRPDQYENWDNRRTLSDYFVKEGERLICVVQCVREEGQSSFDNYDEWLQNYQKKN